MSFFRVSFSQLQLIIPPELDTVCNIAIQILEQKVPCQQEPDQDEEDEPLEDQAEYDSVLISNAGDFVSALANALGSDFSQAFRAFFPLISKFCVRVRNFFLGTCCELIGPSFLQKKSRSLSDRSSTVGCLAEIISGIKSADPAPPRALLRRALRRVRRNAQQREFYSFIHAAVLNA